MLTNKQKKYLRKIAQNKKAIFQIGKEGVGTNLCESIDDALTAHELVKISVLKTCSNPINDISSQIAFYTNSEIVQTIGRVFVLYRRSEQNKMEL